MRAVAVTPDGQHIISGSITSLVKVWSVASKSLVSTCVGHTGAGFTRWRRCPTASASSAAGTDKTVRVWLLDGTLENTFKLHTGYVNALVALPDNQHALSGSDDRTVKLFNVNDGAVLRTFKHHTRRGALPGAADPTASASSAARPTAQPASSSTASRRSDAGCASILPGTECVIP